LQMSAAEHMNQYGFVPLWTWLKREKLRSRILLHMHDALVCSCPVDEVYDVARFARDSLEIERDYGGTTLALPLEFALGCTWAVDTVWGALPSREEMEAQARKLHARSPV